MRDRNMKKQLRTQLTLFLITLLVAVAPKAEAQQVPLYNQYYYSGTIAFPSASPFAEARYLSFVYRDQFGGLVGAPTNFAFAYNSSINEKTGFNANITTADIGFTSQVKVSGGIGYKLFGEGKDGLSIGSQMSLSFFSLNDERVNPENPADVALADILGQNGSSLSFDLTASFRSGNWAVDVALPTLINESLSDDAYLQINDDNVPDFIGGVKYSYRVKPDLVFTPYLGIRLRETIGAEIDIMGEFNFKEQFRFFGGYRDNYGSTIGVGAQVFPKLLFTYNYDFGSSDTPFLADGFNEFGLHYQLGTKQERVNACVEEGRAVVDRILSDRIFDENLVNLEDRNKALCYLSSLEVGKRKEKNMKAEEAYKALFAKIKEEELAKQEAARLAALQREQARQDSIKNAEIEAEKRRQAALAEAERKRLELQEEVKQEEIKKVLSLATESVQFNTSSSVLTTSSYESLDQVATLLMENPEVRLALEGYTDNTGNADNNLRLSEARAQSVKSYLVDKGVDESRVTAAGFGIANPRADNSTKEGRALNRRVEMKIIQD